MTITALIVTKNEAPRIAACIKALHNFSDILVVDSNSDDDTVKIAKNHGARTQNFTWNGNYPKKRQYCLDHLDLPHEWIFFVDADEIVPPALVEEIQRLDFSAAGYFVKGVYMFEQKILRFGLRNNKLALINRNKINFPIIDDLDIPGMGEIEGHYQPVLKVGHEHEPLGQLRTSLVHLAYEDRKGWEKRHARYALWESGMDRRAAWPRDPEQKRAMLKILFKRFPSFLRPLAAFMHCYIFKLGFLDGARGLRFAMSRFSYYKMISSASKIHY